MKPKKVQDCVHLRHLRYTKYETDFYFDKKSETFFAKVPPDERIRAPSVEELEKLVRAHHETYLVPGQWIKKIYVVVTGSQGDTGGGLFYGMQNGQGQSRDLNVSFTLFEERDSGCPPGTRMGRQWNPDPHPMWDDHPNRVYGQDIKDALEGKPEEGQSISVLDWTQEREDALLEIQKAMAQLQTRLGELVKRPELIAGAKMGLLGPGKEHPLAEANRLGEDLESQEEGFREEDWPEGEPR